MSESIKGCVVTFRKDLGEDRARILMDAILQIQEVISVDKLVASYDDLVNRNQIRNALMKKLWETFE